MIRRCKLMGAVSIPSHLRGERIEGNWFDIDYSQTDGSGTVHVRGVYNPKTNVLANIIIESNDADYNRMTPREIVECIQ